MEKPTLRVGSVSRMSPEDHARLREQVEAHGCVHLIQTGEQDSPVDTLRALSVHFGDPVFHNLSDEYGIHTIRYIPGYPEYANANVEELGLHTDGSFEKTPPAFMLIHCEAASGEGGDSTLASGDRLYNHLKAAHPDYLAALSAPGAFTIWRDDRMAERSVFTQMGKRIRLAYRSGYDVRIDIREDAVEAFHHVRDWLLQPENFVRFKLQPGETLIFDNMRMLHGRTAFSRDSNRSLYGLWCNGVSGDGNAVSCGIDPGRLAA